MMMMMMIMILTYSRNNEIYRYVIFIASVNSKGKLSCVRKYCTLKEYRDVGVQLQPLEILIIDGGVHTLPHFGHFDTKEKERNRVEIVLTLQSVWSSRRGNCSHGYYCL